MAQVQNFVPVTDDLGSFIGIVTRRDILQYYYKLTHPELESKGQSENKSAAEEA
jgi:CBS domain containing-hemolysin-like protein